MRIGILGAGGFARFMRDEMRRVPEIEVAAVASRSPHRLAEFDAPLRFNDYEAMLTSGEVDAVYNALSNDLHFPWTTVGLAHGLPVLCEKPLGLDAQEAALMHDAAVASQVPLLEGFWHLFHPRFALMRGLIDAGVIGEVLHINAGFAHSMNFDGNYREDPSRGGGMLLDLGCYPVSAALWLRPGAQVVSATALSVERGVRGADMHIDASLTLSDGVTVTFTASANRTPRRWIEVVGSDGVLHVDGIAFSHHPEPEAGTRLIFTPAESLAEEVQEWIVPASDPRAEMLNHFLDLAAGVSAPQVPAELSVLTAHALDTVRDSVDAQRD
jgi:predicted dehydrogenase